MILCDIGNTSYHFLTHGVDSKKSVESFDPSTITETVFYISVNKRVKELLKPLKNWIDLSLHVEMKNFYATMGIDRVLASLAVQNAIIIDAGSAVTVDVVKDGEFMGGFIYPGVRAMSKTYKDISPALEYEFNFDINLEILPKNSQDAISYGYLKTLHVEVMKHNMPVILTGGDALKFAKIFPDAVIDESLIFKGMKNIILV